MNTSQSNKRGLIVVDVQNDFCEGGSLAVAGGAAVAAGVTDLLRTDRGRYDVVVATRDYHVDPGDHFAGPEGPNFVTTWPVHCKVGTPGAEYHPQLDTSLVDVHVTKGEFEAAYSGFEGVVAGDQTLGATLAAEGVTSVDVVGIATDHCVRATALDARRLGLEVRVLLPLCAGVAPETTETALAELVAAGVEVLR